MDFYIGQVFLWAGTWIPSGFAACQGQLLNISTYAALYSIIGTTYGGNGQTTFALPNLSGVVPVGVNPSGIPIGQTGGQPLATLEDMGQTAPLTLNNLPAHTHTIAPGSISGNPLQATINIPAVGSYDAATASGTPGPTMSFSVPDDSAIGGSPTIYSTATPTTALKPFTAAVSPSVIPPQPVPTSSTGLSTGAPLTVNMPGALAMYYIICVNGLYPSRP